MISNSYIKKEWKEYCFDVGYIEEDKDANKMEEWLAKAQS